ncbi:MAG: hypothetical protein WCD33_09130 [Mycobacterium sp.]|uniref:hypothetical protein n=1 Tax=Mycobacterium sp. TaxID=1785 RepID=UPI003C791348
MSTNDNDQTSSEVTDKDQDQDQETSSEVPELSDEGKEKVRQMQQAYDDDRPTAVLPGTDGTITGVAINEWLDDDGNPKFGKEKQEEREKEDAKGESEQEDARGESEQHAEKAEKA